MTDSILQKGRFAKAFSSSASASSASLSSTESMKKEEEEGKGLKLNHMLSFGLDKLFEESEDVETAASQFLFLSFLSFLSFPCPPLLFPSASKLILIA